MSDDLELTSQVNDDEPEGSQQPDISERAAESWERRLERYGLKPADSGDEPAAEPRQARAEKPVQRQPAAQEQPLPKPKQFVQERERRTHRVTRLEEQVSQLMEQNRTLMGLLQGKDVEPPADADEDPRKYTQELVKAAVLEALGGEEVVQYLQDSRQRHLDAEERAELVRQQREEIDGWREEMTGYEQEYFERKPERREPYLKKLAHFMGESMQIYIERGYNKRDAYARASFNLMALMNDLKADGYNPAEFFDFKAADPGEAPAAGKDPKKVAQEKANREAKERRDAAAAAGGTLSVLKAPPAASTSGKIAAAAEGRPGSARALINASKRAGGNAKAALRDYAANGRG